MIDWLHLPPLAALRAFAAYAETGNVTQAGARLNVTHAAISQQIRTLEAHLGFALLDRRGRQAALTDEGKRLAWALKEGFGTIAGVVEELTGADAERPLHISTTPLFASVWLMPQLAGFHAEHPEADLIVSTTPTVQPLEPGGIDVALRYGDGNWGGLQSEVLLRSPMVLVAAPSLVGDRVFRRPSDLVDLPLIQDTGISEASNWLVKSGLIEHRSAGLLQLPGNLILDAARDGRGVVVAIRAFVEQDIKAGRLKLLFENDDAKGYHIVTRADAVRPVAKTFLKWLRRCARDCVVQQ